MSWPVTEEVYNAAAYSADVKALLRALEEHFPELGRNTEKWWELVRIHGQKRVHGDDVGGIDSEWTRRTYDLLQEFARTQRSRVLPGGSRCHICR